MASKPGKNVSSQKSAPAKPKSGIASTTRAATPTPPKQAAQSRPANVPAKSQTTVTPAGPTSKPMTKVEAKPGVNLSVNDGRRPAREAIAEAAYFLWLQRGGSDITNWLDAEALLARRVNARV